MTFNQFKCLSGIVIVGLGGIAISSAIGLGIYNPYEYSEFAMISSLGGVVLAMLGNLKSIERCFSKR